MIINFRQKDSTRFEGLWDGQAFVLTTGADGKWHLYIDGKAIKGSWATASIAKRQIDLQMERHIAKLVKENGDLAQQNAPSITMTMRSNVGLSG